MPSLVWLLFGGPSLVSVFLLWVGIILGATGAAGCCLLKEPVPNSAKVLLASP